MQFWSECMAFASYAVLHHLHSHLRHCCVLWLDYLQQLYLVEVHHKP